MSPFPVVVVNLLFLLIGLSYTLRLPEFVDQFVQHEHGVQERQSIDLSDQILPIFLIAFSATLVNSLVLMSTSAAGQLN